MNSKELLNYFKNDLKWGWSYQAQIVYNFLIKASKEAKGGVVLDAGAGYQRYKPFFNESLYIAQEHPEAGKKNKKITEYDILCDVKNIPLKDCSVDLILSTSSLEHLEFPDEFFKETYRVLKPGGVLYINVPFVIQEHEIPFDFCRYTRYGLKKLYSHSGFENINVLPTSSSISTAEHLFRHAIVEDAVLASRFSLQRLFNKTLLYSIYILNKILLKLYDKGPKDYTTLPVGWISYGHKTGIKESISYDSKKDFVEKNAKIGNGIILKDGKLLPE